MHHQVETPTLGHQQIVRRNTYPRLSPNHPYFQNDRGYVKSNCVIWFFQGRFTLISLRKVKAIEVGEKNRKNHRHIWKPEIQHQGVKKVKEFKNSIEMDEKNVLGVKDATNWRHQFHQITHISKTVGVSSNPLALFVFLGSINDYLERIFENF